MKIYKFRNVRLDVRERSVTKNGNRIELSPKAFDILQMLVESAGEIVSRDEILGRVWNGSLVEDGNLSVYISKLRKTLGETRNERFIETVAGTGYRLLPPIEISTSGQNHIEHTETTKHPGSNGFHGSDTEAIRLFLKGRYFLEKRNPVDVQKAIKFLERSIAYDPLNVHAYADLVKGYRLIHCFDLISSSDALTKINPILSMMKDLGPDLEVTHVTIGEVLAYLRWKFEEAETHFRTALSINPNCLSAYYRIVEFLSYAGRFSEVLTMMPTLTRLDPFSLQTYLRISKSMMMMEKYESALLYLNDSLELEPENLETLAIYGAVLAETGDYSKAIEVFTHAQSSFPTVENSAMIGYIHALKNERLEAEKIINHLLDSEYDSGSLKTHLARIFLTLGEKDEGYSLLDQAVQLRCSDLMAIRVDPRWKAVRHEERFQEIVRKVWPE